MSAHRADVIEQALQLQYGAFVDATVADVHGDLEGPRHAGRASLPPFGDLAQRTDRLDHLAQRGQRAFALVRTKDVATALRLASSLQSGSQRSTEARPGQEGKAASQRAGSLSSRSGTGSSAGNTSPRERSSELLFGGSSRLLIDASQGDRVPVQ